MDNEFNPITPESEPEINSAENTAAESAPAENAPRTEPPKATAPAQQQSDIFTRQYSAPYSAPNVNPYSANGAQYSAQYANGSANPYSAYNGANQYGQQPQYGAYNQQAYGQRPQQMYPPVNNTPVQPQKKKSKTGRNVFIVIACICVIAAITAIIVPSFKQSTPANSGKKNNSATEGTGAKPYTEDSPYSFEEYSGSGAMTSEQIYAAVKEINVGVLVYSQNQKVGEGSGIIVGEDDEGNYTYIITCAHVISDKGTSVQVQFYDETEIDATVVGFDTKTDVGVLKVNKTGFKAAVFGNSDKLSVGQKVYAIGNPGGTEFFGSFTGGMISAIDRPIASTSSAYDLPCIQHNAAINPGNSGGALVNEYGQVIGLNSSKIADTNYEGMGFSVPSNTMLNIYNELITHGYVTNRPILGINYYAVSSDYTYAAVAWKNNLPYGSIVIAGINENSDVKNSSVKVGDIIIGVNGEKLDTTDVLLEVIENGSVGDTITLTVCRLNNNGSVNTTFDAKVKLVEDDGTNTVEQEEPVTEDPFSKYFGNFGFGY